MCCPGCKAVATLIRDAGFERYYTSREAPDPGIVRPPDEAAEWQVFDRDDMLAAFAEREGDLAEASIYVGGMYCAACSWLIDSTLQSVPGINSADINPVTHRLRVAWDPGSIGLGGSSVLLQTSATSRSHWRPTRRKGLNERSSGER